MNDKAKFGAEPVQFPDAGLGVTTEAKVFSLMQTANAESIHQNIAHKLFGRKTGERGVKGQRSHSVNAGGLQQAHALVHGREQMRRTRRAKKTLGMRVKGNGNGTGSQRTGFAHHGGENFLMPSMYAVEVADCGDDGPKTSRHVRHESVDRDGRLGELAHRVTATARPSWERATPGGSVRLVCSWPSSCAMCVSQVWRAPMRCAQPSACSTVAWLGFGLWRNAESTR